MKKIISILFAAILVALSLYSLKNFFYDHKKVASNGIATEKTFAIIKPDAVQAKNSGKIIDLVENHGFDILGLRKVTLTKNQAKQFYDIHKEKPFFKDLITYVTSAPSIVMVLQRENAVQEWRNLMGETNPEKAHEGTIRKLFGTDITHNATHGSDSIENAKVEIEQFFSELI